MNSDHVLVLGDTDLTITNHRGAYRRTDYQKFKKLVLASSSKCRNAKEMYDMFCSCFRSASTWSFFKARAPKPYWTKELQYVKRMASRLYKYDRNSPEFKRARNRFRSMQRSAMRRHDRSLKTALKKDKNGILVWKVVRFKSSSYGGKQDVWDWTAQDFCDAIKPNFDMPYAISEDYINHSDRIGRRVNPKLDPITYEDLCSFLPKLRDSAPGADGIPNRALRLLITEAPSVLLRFINMILESGEFPDFLKTGMIKGIPKPHPPNTPAPVPRPITLLSTLGKLV